jgi:multicomponent Na+:H+ antiporter subunit E
MPTPSPAPPAPAPARGARWRTLARRALPLALLWVLLSGGAAASWVVGVPAVLAAALLLPAPAAQGWRLRAAGVPGFVAFFVRESWRGGVDVALRVLGPRLRVQPGLVWHRWQLPAEGPGRTLFVLCASLLPGTLVAEQRQHGALIHALDTGAAVAAELAALERAIAGLFVAPRTPAAAQQTDG